jgi:immunity protein 8 of polymorphic toxin system
MKAKFKRSYVAGSPESPDIFQLTYHVDVSVVDDDDSELPGLMTFIFDVVSPKWIEKYLNPSQIMLGRHFIIARDANLDLVDEKLSDFVNTFTGETAEEIDQKLEKIGRSDNMEVLPVPDRHFL